MKQYEFNKAIKKQVLVFVILFFGLFFMSEAGDVKRGWNIGALPAIGYVSDLGFQYGALCDLFYYGDGSKFPQYVHKFSFQASRYTKGSGIFHFFYDSKFLIPSLRVTLAASYLPDKMKGFYGFNGYASPYDDQFNTAFYAIDRKMTRILANVQGNISGGFSWAAGVNFWNYKIDRVNDEEYVVNETLYDIYVNSGIIGQDEANGGACFELKAGLIYDTRDFEPAPSKGLYAELIAYGSPDLIERKDNAYLKLSAQVCNYIPLVNDKLVFATRAVYQGTIAGLPPFYMQQNISTLYLRQINNEGLGGVNTIRGVLFNRLVGDGYFWCNSELRWKAFNFKFLKQDWYCGMNPFLDFGRVVQSYKLDDIKESNSLFVYSGHSEKMHLSAGLGLKAAMNRNFVISIEWAKPFEKSDGKQGLYFGLNYIF